MVSDIPLVFGYAQQAVLHCELHAQQFPVLLQGTALTARNGYSTGPFLSVRSPYCQLQPSRRPSPSFALAPRRYRQAGGHHVLFPQQLSVLVRGVGGRFYRRRHLHRLQHGARGQRGGRLFGSNRQHRRRQRHLPIGGHAPW